MGGVTETEFKLALPDEQARQRLLAALGCGPGVTFRQTNHFFDSPERSLRRHEIALRLRQAEGRHELALKGPRRAAGSTALHERQELELVLTAEEAQAILGGTRSPLAPFLELDPRPELVRTARELAAGRPLLHLGSFENERTRLGPIAFAGGPALALELDRTAFPAGRVEHELEVELRAEDAGLVEPELRALLREAKISWSPASSKAERFFRILDG
jgi:uncharacterized protein YjbK